MSATFDGYGKTGGVTERGHTYSAGQQGGAGDGLHETFAELGFSYVSGYLPTLDGTGAWLDAPPCRVASACDGAVVVVHFALRADVSLGEAAGRLLSGYRARYTHLLAVLTQTGETRLHLAATCRDATGAPAITALWGYEPEELTDATLATLTRLRIGEEDADPLSLMARFAEALTDAAASSVAAPTKARSRDTFVVDTVQWWCGQFGARVFLSADEERELARRVREEGSKTARTKLFNANRRLAVFIAHKYVNRGLDLSDLIQEANLGLIHAIDLFDGRNSCRLKTYASYWIRQSIGQAIENHGCTIRLPSSAIRSSVQVNRAMRSIEGQVTNERIAFDTGFWIERVAELRDLPRASSSDAPVGDGEQSLIETIPDTDPCHVPYARAFRRASREEIVRAVKQLTPREREVLELHYGLTEDSKAPITMKQIGDELHLLRSSVWKIEATALQKLRCSEIGGLLRETVLDGSNFEFNNANYRKSVTQEVVPLPAFKVPILKQGSPHKPEAPHKKLDVELYCRVCKKSVDFKKTIDGGWYRCRCCNDRRFVLNDAIVSHETTCVPRETVAPADFVCRACAAPVELKPSFGGKWYRCTGCGDKRVIPAAELAGASA